MRRSGRVFLLLVLGIVAAAAPALLAQSVQTAEEPGLEKRYGLAGLGRLDGATELLRIAVELHPKEANLYDSLGELELKAGRSEAAVAAYKKALGIDPKFESSIKALEAIQRKEK